MGLFVETCHGASLQTYAIEAMPFLSMVIMEMSFLGRRDESRLYKGWMVSGTMAFVINVCARRDVDLSRLEKQRNPIVVDLSRLGLVMW